VVHLGRQAGTTPIAARGADTARQDRSLKAILIRILKWLLGIPIAFVLFLGMWFTIFGGI
jgi:hypothetical protein